MKSKLEINSEKLITVQEENEKLRQKNEELEAECVKLAGNQNQNERIKYMQKLKKQCNDVQNEKEKVDKELYKYRRRYGDLKSKSEGFEHLESQVDELQHSKQQLLETIKEILNCVAGDMKVEISGESLQERVMQATQEIQNLATAKARLQHEAEKHLQEKEFFEQQIATKNEHLGLKEEELRYFREMYGNAV